MKFCPHCGETKDHAEFHRASHTTDGLQGWCKSCMRKRRMQDGLKYSRAAAASGAHRKAELKYRYGMTPEQYAEMLADQNGGCALCGRTPEQEGRSLPVDHDHRTGLPRGILCTACNLKIGRSKVRFSRKELLYIHQFDDVEVLAILGA